MMTRHVRGDVFMRCVLLIVFVVILAWSPSYALNELQRMDFSARYSVLNSSVFADDGPGAFVNPAALFRVDRLNATVGTSAFQSIGHLGVSGVLPFVGGALSLTVYQLDDTVKRGLSLGWGRDLAGWLAAGIAVKSVSGDRLEFGDGMLFDAGLILKPNESTGWDLFRNPALNNRLFFGFAVQNLGIQPVRAQGEDLALRLGAGYDIPVVWTKVFLEKHFLSSYDRFVIGAEFHPEPAGWRFLFLRLSYDFEDVRLGAGVSGQDYRVDVSYHAGRQFVQFALTGYFERDRAEISREIYEEGVTLQNRAQRLESRGDDQAYLVYHKAYQKFGAALNYDPNNRKAALRKARIDDKITDYQSAYLSRAAAAEEKKDPVTALQYYNMAAEVQDSPVAREKIRTLSTNRDVLSHAKQKKTEIRSLIRSGRYLTARQAVVRLVQVVPSDGEAASLQREIDGHLARIAQRYFQKAQDLYRRSFYEESIAQARTALRYDPDLDRASDLIELAAAERDARRGFDRAQEQFRAKNYLGALKIANSVLARTPNHREAQDLKNRILRIFRDNAKSYLQTGVGYYNTGEFDKAVEEFDKVLLADTNNSAAQEYRSRALARIKAMEKLEGIGDE